MEAVASTDHTINNKESEEMEKYQDLAQELRKAKKRIWTLRLCL